MTSPVIWAARITAVVVYVAVAVVVASMLLVFFNYGEEFGDLLRPEALAHLRYMVLACLTIEAIVTVGIATWAFRRWTRKPWLKS